MPLRCQNETRATVYAFGHDDPAWASLIVANRLRRHLRTHCCDAPVALKTSRLGTRFFAHLARGGCATGDETPEHLHLKSHAVEAARRHGWDAATEEAGETPSGEPWRADVLATKGKNKVAIEVQWSPQDDAETLRRQARYAASGVRGLWLFRQADFPDSGDLPAMRVRGSLAKGFTAFGLPIADVLYAVFDRRLGFGIPTGRKAMVTMTSVVVHCWDERCAAVNRAIDEIVVAYGDNECVLTLRALTGHPVVAEAVLRGIPADSARGRIMLRASRTLGETYLSNGCFRCDRLLGDHFLPPAAGSRSVVARLLVTIDPHWRAAIDSVPEFEPAWSIAPLPPTR